MNTGCRKLAILGLGLMGGSLGMAARRLRSGPVVSAYARREETRRMALSRGAADAVYETPEEAVQDADLVVVCTPVLAMEEILERCIASLAPGSVVTDVGSTKRQIVERCTALLDGSDAEFVGSHPIAGSERAGLEAARPDLYESAIVVVTSGPDARDDMPDGKGVARIKAFWEALECRVTIMDAETHDRIIAKTSHLPHLVAAMLVDCVLGGGEGPTKELCGSGFSDTTRIAAGSELIWRDIIASNREDVARELEGFAAAVDACRDMIAREDLTGLEQFLARVREQREGLR